MARIFLGLLAVGWGLVLIPAGLRRRSERGSFSILGLGASIAGLGSVIRRSSRRSPLWSAECFSGQSPFPGTTQTGFGFGATRQPGTPHPQYVSRVVRRQRHVVIGLFSAAVVTLLLSLVPGLRFLLAIHAIVDVALALYFVALVRIKETRSPNGRPAMRYAPREQQQDRYYDRAS